jgi:hypothetical protein
MYIYLFVELYFGKHESVFENLYGNVLGVEFDTKTR